MLVDTGALHLILTTALPLLLELRKVSRARAVLAQDQRLECDVVGPIELCFANRRGMVEALVGPDADECLLGAIPMENRDVIIDPVQQCLRVNPDSPDRTQATLKGMPA